MNLASVKGLARYRALVLPTAILAFLVWGAAVVTRVNLETLVDGIPRGVELWRHMFPPAWDTFSELLAPALETVQIAFVGTVFGVLIALVVSFVAATNINSNRADYIFVLADASGEARDAALSAAKTGLLTHPHRAATIVIEAIAPQGSQPCGALGYTIDVANGYVKPGFIDIHSDYIEFMAAPRPTSLMDFQIAIRETERQLVAHGITTIFHSVSLSKGSAFARKPIREAENVQQLMESIAYARQGQALIRHNFHMRFEIDNLGELDNVRSYILNKKVQLLSFMDHSPGANTAIWTPTAAPCEAIATSPTPTLTPLLNSSVIRLR